MQQVMAQGSLAPRVAGASRGNSLQRGRIIGSIYMLDVPSLI